MNQRQRRLEQAGSAGAIEIGLGGAAGKMRDAVEAALRHGFFHVRRKPPGLDRAIDHRGEHAQSALGEIERAGAVLARKIEQRQLRAGKPRAQELREVALVAVGAVHVAKACSARGLRAVAAGGEGGQRREPPARRMRRDGARGIGAGHHHGGERLVRKRDVERLHPQQRRHQHRVAVRAQGSGGALAIGLSPRDQEAHALAGPEKARAGARLELTPGIGAERDGIGDGAFAPALVELAAVGAGDQAGEREPAVGDRGVAGDRRAAGAVEHGEEGALGRERDRAAGMIDGGEQLARAAVVGARLDGDDALPDRRQELVDRQHRGGGVGASEPLQAGEREQRGVDLAGGELAQPGLDVAAQAHHREVGPGVLDQRLAPQRSGADDRAGRKIEERRRPGADEDVAGVLARQHGRDREPGGQRGRHVLGRMHREIDGAGAERLLDLLGEQALAAGLGQRPVLDHVAGGADGLDRDLIGSNAMRGGEAGAHFPRLGERERAAARADAQQRRRTGARGLHAITSQCYARCRAPGAAQHERSAVVRADPGPLQARSLERSDQRRSRFALRRVRDTIPQARRGETILLPEARMLVLGIETTCDETAAAVVERPDAGPGVIRSNVVLSQIEAHAAFGGVVPEIAARAHVEALDVIIAKAMTDAGVHFAELDGIAAAAGPGLIGGVIVGLTTAKAIALVAEKPLIAVNHLEAHALTVRLTDDVAFPYCLFLASGGHTQIVAVLGVGQYVRLGTTVDDAIGEAFDKTAKLLGLGYPGGPQVEREARAGSADRFTLPRPMLGRKHADFSLSGLKTALRLEAEKIAPLGEGDVRDLCAGFQQSVVDVVTDRLTHGVQIFRERFGQPTALVAAGGVAANAAIRTALGRVAIEAGTVLVMPAPALCTDNGAMIAWAGAERLALGLTDMLDARPHARWLLSDVTGPPKARGVG